MIQPLVPAVEAQSQPLDGQGIPPQVFQLVRLYACWR